MVDVINFTGGKLICILFSFSLLCLPVYPMPPPIPSRHIFLFDLAVIVCKRKGDNYEMKEIIDLQQYKIANNPTTDKENKKVKI